MRIKSDGHYSYRTDLYDDTAELLGENTRSKGLAAACEFTRRMIQNLERAVKHEDMTQELAEILSTANVKLSYEIETEVNYAGD